MNDDEATSTGEPSAGSSFWDAGFDVEAFVRANADDLRLEFGEARIQETAYPVYTNRLKAARWLGIARLEVAHRFARRVGPVATAVDFGSGLGVSLPGLSSRAERVYAVDVDTEVTSFMVDRLKLPNVIVVSDVSEVPEPIDLLYALDVFEHIVELEQFVRLLAERTAPLGTWVVSGPTENTLYRSMRKLARTSAEGHVRAVDRVFDIVSGRLCMDDHTALPLDVPAPLTLFDVGLFHKRA